ncbi:MAG: Rab family GTPase [Candidatus Helarchaeota archaeon]
MTEKGIIYGIIHAQFNNKLGPIPIAWTPADLADNIKGPTSFKSINLLLSEGESIIPGSLAIIPFPSLNLKGLVRCFKVKDENAISGFRESSITIIFKEEHDPIFYKYIRNFEPKFDNLIAELENVSDDDIEKGILVEKITEFYYDLNFMLDELREAEISFKKTDEFPETEEDEDIKKYTFKIIVVGDVAVGKTSIILRFTDNAFRKTYLPTMGVNISEKVIRRNGTNAKLTLWDLAGQTKFQIMRKHFYQGADGKLLVFDLTRPKSFKSMVDWHKDIKKHCDQVVLGLLVGNKSDLEDERRISNEEIFKLSSRLDLEYVETSALTGENIDKAFYALSEKLIAIADEKKDNS